MKTLYLIGIDAAPLWLIKKFSTEKGMEGFMKLIKNGNLVEMESTLPPMTGAAWPTIYTGLPPGKHGVPDFFAMQKDYVPELVYYDSSREPPFWAKLAEKGYSSLVITPATDITLPDYPGVDMITGFPLKAKSNTPLLQSLMKKHSFYGEPDVEKEMKSGSMSEKEGGLHFLKSTAARAEIAKEAMQSKEYNLVYVCFTETDRLQHFVLNKSNMAEYLLPIYQEIGKYTNYVMEKATTEGGSVMIVSDHGAQPIKKKFLINNWMISEGFAFLKGGVAPAGSGDNNSYAMGGLREKLIKTRMRKVYDSLPHGAKSLVSRSVGMMLPSSKGGKFTRIHLFDFDMEKTLAFAAISNINVSTIWINDSRFVNGHVGSKEKAALIKKIKGRMLRLKDPSGKQLILNIYDGRKYYGNTRKFIPPDILAEIRPGYMMDIFYYSGETMFMDPEPPKRGDHTRYGIFGTYPEAPLTKSGKFKITEVYRAVLSHYGK